MLDFCIKKFPEIKVLVPLNVCIYLSLFNFRQIIADTLLSFTHCFDYFDCYSNYILEFNLHPSVKL